MLSFPNPKQLLFDTLIHSFKKTRRSWREGKLKIDMSLFDIILNELFLPKTEIILPNNSAIFIKYTVYVENNPGREDVLGH